MQKDYVEKKISEMQAADGIDIDPSDNVLPLSSCEKSPQQRANSYVLLSNFNSYRFKEIVVTEPILQGRLWTARLLRNETACKGRRHTRKVFSCTSEGFPDRNDGNVLKPFKFLDTT